MKVLVPVKRVVDFTIKVRVKSDGSGVDLAKIRMAMNPFDETAAIHRFTLGSRRDSFRSNDKG